MADRGPLSLTIKLQPSDDRVITCFVCNQPGVDYEWTWFIPGRKAVIGMHSHCAEMTGEVRAI